MHGLFTFKNEDELYNVITPVPSMKNEGTGVITLYSYFRCSRAAYSVVGGRV